MNLADVLIIVVAIIMLACIMIYLAVLFFNNEYCNIRNLYKRRRLRIRDKNIIKRPELLPVECPDCGTIFLPTWKNIDVHNFVYCPSCHRACGVNFKKEEKKK